MRAVEWEFLVGVFDEGNILWVIWWVFRSTRGKMELLRLLRKRLGTMGGPSLVLHILQPFTTY